MSETNIESRLENIMSKLKTSIEMETNLKEHQDVINNLLIMFPHLETKSSVNKAGKDNNETPSASSDSMPKKDESKKEIEEMTFDQINVNGKIYFIDQSNVVWNDKAELVGSLLGYTDKKEPIVSFFDSKIKDDTNKIDRMKKTLYK